VVNTSENLCDMYQQSLFERTVTKLKHGDKLLLPSRRELVLFLR
jgi:hypothetical protein